ncbi:MAG: formate dehydrogenase subunit delta [Rhodanobacteraceae bacterium]|nr:formate dehydrogenase subunit delta [Rhodanobacteraceae bacterium]
MDVKRLNAMANDIAAYFASEPDREAAIAGIVNHIRKSWDPRMRRQITQQSADDAAGLIELARAAIDRLTLPPDSRPPGM